MDFDTQVKLAIYDTVARTTLTPTTGEVAQALDAPLAEVEAAFERLHQKRLLVPEPGDPRRIRMAPPFSGIETPFRVRIQDKAYYANCAWDALGVVAALHQDAMIEAADGHSDEPITLTVDPLQGVKGGQPQPEPCVVHFAVPAARWWADIVYT